MLVVRGVIFIPFQTIPFQKHAKKETRKKMMSGDEHCTVNSRCTDKEVIVIRLLQSKTVVPLPGLLNL